MKCANCDKDAQYVYRLTAQKSILYCAKDLPKFLEPRLKAGLLELTTSHKELIEEALPNIIFTPESTTDTTPKKKPTKKPVSDDAPNP
jgi:hypothetical protein